MRCKSHNTTMNICNRRKCWNILNDINPEKLQTLIIFFLNNLFHCILSILHVNDAWKKLSSLLWRHTPAGRKLTRGKREKTYRRRIKRNKNETMEHPSLSFAFVFLIRTIIYNLWNLFDGYIIWFVQGLCSTKHTI